MKKPMLCVLLLATGPLCAQDAASPPPEEQQVELTMETVVTPQAQAVLDRMSASLAALQQFEVSAWISRDEVMPYGYKLQNNEHARMWLKRPDKLRVEVDGDIKTRTYVFDGSQLTIAAPDANLYAVTQAKGTTRELVELLQVANVEMPLIDLLYHGSLGSLTENVRVGLRVGDSEIDGVAVDHLVFRQPDVDWQLWVQKGENALPRKLLITTRYAVGDPQWAAVLTWDTKARPGAKDFTYVPPKDATKVPFGGALAASGGGQ